LEAVRIKNLRIIVRFLRAVALKVRAA